MQLAWQQEGGGHASLEEGEASLIQETAWYLLPLLDEKKDAVEIAEINEKVKKAKAIGRWVTPILVPMEKHLRFDDLVDVNRYVNFDLDGQSDGAEWQWITPKAAWLVYDPERRGKITSGLQLFGGRTFWIFWQSGYDALSSLDNNHDGVLSGTELDGIALWRDLNSDGVSQTNEVTPVADLGIESISTNSQKLRAGVAWSRTGVVFRDGHSLPTYDWVSASRMPAR